MQQQPKKFQAHTGGDLSVHDIDYINAHGTSTYMNDINEDSSILDFIMGFSTKAINFINTLIKLKKIKYEINFELQESPLSLNYVKNTIKSVEMRRECVQNGYAKAQEFLEILQNGQDLLNKLG
jgi:hypothetical protein